MAKKQILVELVIVFFNYQEIFHHCLNSRTMPLCIRFKNNIKSEYYILYM